MQEQPTLFPNERGQAGAALGNRASFPFAGDDSLSMRSFLQGNDGNISAFLKAQPVSNRFAEVHFPDHVWAAEHHRGPLGNGTQTSSGCFLPVVCSMCFAGSWRRPYCNYCMFAEKVRSLHELACILRKTLVSITPWGLRVKPNGWHRLQEHHTVILWMVAKSAPPRKSWNDDSRVINTNK